MKVKLRIIFIGILAEATSTSIVEYEVEDARRVADLLSDLLAKYPRLRNVVDDLPLLNIFINGRHSSLNDYVKDGDVIVISPPFYEGG